MDAPRAGLLGRRLPLLIGLSAVLLALAIGSGSRLGRMANPPPLPPYATVPSSTDTHWKPLYVETPTDTHRDRFLTPLHWLSWSLLTIMLLALGAAAVAVALAHRRAMLERRAPAPEEPTRLLPVERFAQEAGGTLEQGLARLHAGDDLDATILACWRGLEDAAAASGIPRASTQTAAEFTRSLLEATAVSPTDLDALASVYRRAMFSDSPTTGTDRATAIAALEHLAADLRRRPGGRRASSAESR